MLSREPFFDRDSPFIRRCPDCDCVLGNEDINDDCDCERCLAHWQQRRQIEREVAANIQWAKNIAYFCGFDQCHDCGGRAPLLPVGNDPLCAECINVRQRQADEAAEREQ